MTEAKLLGRRVRALRDLSNGNGGVKAGTLLTIRGKRGGLQLAMDYCHSCGVSWYVTKVHPYDVELLPEDGGTAPSADLVEALKGSLLLRGGGGA